MSLFYAISDPHGCLDVLRQALSSIDLDDAGNHLFLLGDYVPHQTYDMGEREFVKRCEESIAFVKALCDERPAQITALMGNHERDLLGNIYAQQWSFDGDLARWMRSLPLLEETEWQIFVHAGIDEDAGELWRIGTDEDVLLGKYPATLGVFCKDIVAGHNGVYTIAKMNGEVDPSNCALWDGQSHYFIDGSTEVSGVIPILRFDTEARCYTAFTATSDGVVCDGVPYKLTKHRSARSYQV